MDDLPRVEKTKDSNPRQGVGFRGLGGFGCGNLWALTGPILLFEVLEGGVCFCWEFE